MFNPFGNQPADQIPDKMCPHWQGPCKVHCPTCMMWRPVEQRDKTKPPHYPGNMVYDCAIGWHTTLGVATLHRMDGVQAATEQSRNMLAGSIRKSEQLIGAVAGVRAQLDAAKPPQRLTADEGPALLEHDDESQQR